MGAWGKGYAAEEARRGRRVASQGEGPESSPWWPHLAEVQKPSPEKMV